MINSNNTSPSAMRNWESSANKIADEIYEDLFPQYEVDRSDCIGRSAKQYSNIDLEMMNRLTGDRTQVSEKFRGTNYDDLLLEFYDEHHANKQGWVLYSKAQYMNYFVPENSFRHYPAGLYVVEEEKLKSICEELITKHPNEIRVALNSKKLSKPLEPGIRVITTTDYGYTACSFTISWSRLREMGVEFKRYDIPKKMSDYLLGSPYNH